MPDTPPPVNDLLNAADLLLLGGDGADALARLAEAAAAAPTSPEPHLRMAEIRVAQGSPADLRAALADLERAWALGMDSAALHFLRMRAAFELGDAAQAQAAYQTALALAPEDARLREWGVRLALAAGEPEQALALARAELAANPASFHWARWEAELLLETGDAAGARGAFTALLAAHCPPDLAPGAWAAPIWADVLGKRAAALDRLGEAAAAAADRIRAAALMAGALSTD